MEPRYWYGLGRAVDQAGFGCWQLAGRYELDGNPHGWTDLTSAEAARLVHFALDRGVRFFDTAAGYGAGGSEAILGDALSSSEHAADAVVCTKVALTPLELREERAGQPLVAALEESLRRLRRDRLDILLLHNPPDDFDWRTFDRTALDRLVASGKILTYGVSSRSLAGAERVLDAGFGSCIEWALNLLERRPAGRLLPRLAQAKVNFIARSPLSRGMLTQRGGGADGTAFQDNDFRSRLPRGWVHWSAAAAGRLAPAAAEAGGLPLLALRYCLSFPEVSAVIPGMHKQRHVEDLLAAKACGPLAPDLLARIDTLVERCYPAWA